MTALTWLFKDFARVYGSDQTVDSETTDTTEVEAEVASFTFTESVYNEVIGLIGLEYEYCGQTKLHIDSYVDVGDLCVGIKMTVLLHLNKYNEIVDILLCDRFPFDINVEDGIHDNIAHDFDFGKLRKLIKY